MKGMTPVQAGASVGAVLAGAAAAAALYVNAEGWRTTPYKDPIGIWTDCAGVTDGVVPGKARSDAECVSRTAGALAKHGAEIAPCLPTALPVKTRGAFTSMASNVGAPKFCASSIAASARAGDLKTACIRINQKPDGSPQWVFVNLGTKAQPIWLKLDGLVRRRAAERALCEEGLRS
jgi:lysozyme